MSTTHGATKEGATKENDPRFGRICRVSGIMKRAIVAFMVLLALFAATAIVLTVDNPAAFQNVMHQLLHIERAGIPSAPGSWILVAMLGALPLAILFFALWQGAALFGDFSKGAVFTTQVSCRLRRMGMALAMLTPAQIVVLALATVILTLSNPPGQRQLSIGISSDQVILLLVGVLLLVIGWVMGEVARMAEEHSQIV